MNFFYVYNNEEELVSFFEKLFKLNLIKESKKNKVILSDNSDLRALLETDSLSKTRFGNFKIFIIQNKYNMNDKQKRRFKHHRVLTEEEFIHYILSTIHNDNKINQIISDI